MGTSYMPLSNGGFKLFLAKMSGALTLSSHSRLFFTMGTFPAAAAPELPGALTKVFGALNRASS
jgi:hypothetical protein